MRRVGILEIYKYMFWSILATRGRVKVRDSVFPIRRELRHPSTPLLFNNSLTPQINYRLAPCVPMAEIH